MSLPSTKSDSAFERFLQALPLEYGELARECNAFRRARKLKSPAQLLQAVLCYSGLDQALREVAGTMTLLHERISDTAIHQRLRASVPWVKALLARLMGTEAAPLLAGNLRFVVVDGSTVQGPGAQGTWYRLHLAVDLVKLQVLEVKVTDKHTGERLDHFALQEGDVVLMDRGYNRAALWIEQAQDGVSLIGRYNPHSLNLYDPSGTRIDWEAVLKTALHTQHCQPVQVRAQGEYIEGYVHACRLPAAKAAQARRRARANAQKKGHTVQSRTLVLAEWVMIFTTLPPVVLPTAAVAALYRVRWQVELVIKRLKSLLAIDQLRAREHSALAELYLHGKLLYAWALTKWVRQRCGEDWNRLDQPRRATPWRVWKRLRQELGPVISGVRDWDMSRWHACLEVMQERPRKRLLQTFPAQVNRLIAYCQANGLSNV